MVDQEPQKRKYKRPESWGAIRKLPSGRYQASYLHSGGRYTGPHTFDAVQDARAWLASIRTDIQRGKWKSPSDTKAESFKPYATDWIAQRTTTQGGPLRAKTRVEYERQLEKGLAFFADDKLAEITPARVRQWHSDRISGGKKTAAAAEARLLRAILATAIEDGILETNPVPAKLTKSTTGNIYRVPDLLELESLYEQIDGRFKLAILLAAYGGLRLSEWRSLRRRDLTLSNGRYTVSVSRQAHYVHTEGWIVESPKSARGVRHQVLAQWMTPLVDAHLADVGLFPESLIFEPKGSSEYVHDNDFNKSWNAARDAVGVRGKVREHDLRGFSGSHLMASAGANLIEARDFLGHSTTAVTEKHYIHKVNDRSAELADLMPRLGGREAETDAPASWSQSAPEPRELRA